MALFGPPKTLNVKKAMAATESFFKKDLGLTEVEGKLNGKGGAQIVARGITIFDFETLYCGVCVFESGYMSFAVDFDTELTSAPLDLYEAINAFNKESAGWKAYFDDDSINFDYEVDTVNDETFLDNLKGALDRILDDDSKASMQPMFKYFIKG